MASFKKPMKALTTAFFCAVVLGAGAVKIPGAAQAGEVRSAVPGLAFLSVPVVSIKEARFRKIVKQQYDFSCGSAALATVLSYHYDRPVTEQAVFQSMIEHGDEEKIQKYGFSLLDMKQYLERKGMQANGFKAPLDELASSGIPAIALINLRGYMHFVVIKGVKDGEVLVGDPALGMTTYPRGEFEEMWQGILFVIMEGLPEEGEPFNHERAWLVRHKAPFGTALSRENLASVSLLLPGPNDF